MSTPAAQPGRPSLAAKLGPVHVGMRNDLEVSRHRFRGQPSYVVRDPITFNTHRLDPEDYDVFVSIAADRPLASIFSDLVKRGSLGDDDSESFYQFVFDLHRLGFLQLPVSDDKALYRRQLIKQKARRREKWMGFLFLRVPLWNPDVFLNKTIDYVRPMFSRWFFCLWLALMASAGFVAISEWDKLYQPLEGTLAARNLPLIWISLIVLKVFHELGHSYACKHFGGHVPETGIYLILFTPCAYMDASSSWAFTAKWQRVIVCLAGMYVESIIAALAVFVWAATGPSLLHSLAYNVIFLAGVVTILFNVNPLMRYDGYYILSDLMEVPNLRTRASNDVTAMLKRVFLGLPLPLDDRRLPLRLFMLGYGVMAMLYRVTITIGIAALLAMKMFIVGMVFGAGYILTSAFGALRKVQLYLWHAQETAPIRRRAVAVGLAAFILVPMGLFMIPLPAHVYADGVVSSRDETVIRVKSAGFVKAAPLKPTQSVDRIAPLASLHNDLLLEDMARHEAALAVSRILADAYRFTEPERALQEDSKCRALSLAVDECRQRLLDLEPHADRDGIILQAVGESDVGKYLVEGTPLAVIRSGPLQVRAMMSENDLTRLKVRTGGKALFRPLSEPGQSMEGLITLITPMASRTIPLPALTQAAGGSLVVDPSTGTASQPYFEVIVELPETANDSLPHGVRGSLRMTANMEPASMILTRSLLRFIQKLMRE